VVGKLSVLWQLHSPETAEAICSIYLAFLKIPGLFLPLPPLPPKLYDSDSATALILLQLCFRSIDRVSSLPQLSILYQNVFERRAIEWSFEEQSQGLHEEIVAVVDKPDLLLLLCSHMEADSLPLFFDHSRLIRSLLAELYTLFVEKYSSASVDADFDDFGGS
jgi:hypothetical protein